MNEQLGDYLKARREELELTIEEVSDQTNIARRYLRALEREDFNQLPAEVYVRGFLRTYARLLNLDAETLIADYKECRPEEDENPFPDEDDGSPIPMSLVYWGTVILVVLLGAAVVTLRFGWITPDRADILRGQRTEARINTADEDRLVIRAEAVEKTWARVRYDGLSREEHILTPGQSRTWVAEHTLLLRVGNAGGLKLYHDGEKLPSLGETGDVVDAVVVSGEDGVTLRRITEPDS